MSDIMSDVTASSFPICSPKKYECLPPKRSKIHKCKLSGEGRGLKGNSLSP